MLLIVKQRGSNYVCKDYIMVNLSLLAICNDKIHSFVTFIDVKIHSPLCEDSFASLTGIELNADSLEA